MNDLQLPNFNILRLNFTLKAESDVKLPPFLGSTLRGAFGTALKQLLCFVPHRNCENCWFFEGCNYQYLFESPNLLGLPKEEIHPLLRGQTELPHPFILTSPSLVKKIKSSKPICSIKNFNDDYRSHFISIGDEINFSITLFGKAINLWSYLAVAIRLCAENGIGENRIPFSLKKIVSHDKQGKSTIIYEDENKILYGKELYAANLADIIKFRDIRQLESALIKK
jgi:hypothetical protein